MKILKPFFSCLLFLCSTVAYTQIIGFDTTAITVGPKKLVKIITRTTAQPALNLLVIHDDENTGVAAAEKFLNTHGGRLTELSYGGIRNLCFPLNGYMYQMDPNGMFTRPGAKRSLMKYGRISSDPAIDEALCLGDTLIQTYAKGGLNYIITLHNNTNEMFCINSYKRDSLLKTIAMQLYINPDMDPDDLVFVTDIRFFNYFKDRNINAVLQHPQCFNDGSLSVWAALNNIPYINVEIQHGHTDMQYKILCMVKDLLDSSDGGYLAKNKEEIVEVDQ